MNFEYIYDENSYPIKIEKKEKNKYIAQFQDEKIEIDAVSINKNTMSLKIGNNTYNVYAAFQKENIFVNFLGKQLSFVDADQIESGNVVFDEEAEGVQMMSAPMPGSVVKVFVKEGDIVDKNQICIVVEAMKMENEIRAKFKGKVTAVNAEEKQQVDSSDVLVELEKIEEKGDN